MVEPQSTLEKDREKNIINVHHVWSQYNVQTSQSPQATTSDQTRLVTYERVRKKVRVKRPGDGVGRITRPGAGWDVSRVRVAGLI